MQKLSDDPKQYEDKAKKYINKAKQYSDKAKKYRDEILKLVKTSKEPGKPNIDTSKIMNTDKASITDEALKVSDNSDSIDEKIVNIEKENQLSITILRILVMILVMIVVIILNQILMKNIISSV